MKLADPASNANSHTLTAASRDAEDPTSSGVPPPLLLLVAVDVPELEVELCACDVLVEACVSASGVTVVPTTAMLVVVGSGLTVTGTTTVVVEDVAAALGVEDVDVVELVDELVVKLVVELVLILVLTTVVDVLASVAAGRGAGEPFCPPLCPYAYPPPPDDEFSTAPGQSV